MRHVELNKGLERIRRGSFSYCVSLERIKIPSSVKKIGHDAFMECSSLAQVELEEGLERIRCGAFSECTSLTHIRVPSTVIEIEQGAFKKCDNSLAVKFCDEIEELMSYSAVLDWWNVGAAEVSLKIFKLLVQHNLAQRLGLLKASKWRKVIYDMLERSPDVARLGERLDCHFASINSTLAVYESLRDVAFLLELALWKSTISQQNAMYNDNICIEKKLHHRINCGADVVIPNVLSFLLQFPIQYMFPDTSRLRRWNV